jgi:hypothetical protein
MRVTLGDDGALVESDASAGERLGDAISTHGRGGIGVAGHCSLFLGRLGLFASAKPACGPDYLSEWPGRESVLRARFSR